MSHIKNNGGGAAIIVDDSEVASVVTSSPSRTIQVKIGSQPAKSMTPDQAANYLKSIAGGATATTTTTSSSSGGSLSSSSSSRRGNNNTTNNNTNRQAVQMTLGQFSAEFVAGYSSSSNGHQLPAEFVDFCTAAAAASSSSNSSTAITGSSSTTTTTTVCVGGTTISSTSGSTGNAMTATLSGGGGPSSSSGAAASSLLMGSNPHNNPSSSSSSSSATTTRNNHNKNNSINNNSGMPCSEKEMKALMSMFVEIMGLQIQTEHLSTYQQPPGTLERLDFPAGVPPPKATASSASASASHDGTVMMDGWPQELHQVVRSRPSDYDHCRHHPMPELEAHPQSVNRTIATLEELAVRIQAMPHVTTTTMGNSNNNGSNSNSHHNIERLDWESLESWAMEDALEQEERGRKQRHKQQQQQPPQGNSLPHMMVLGGGNGPSHPLLDAANTIMSNNNNNSNTTINSGTGWSSGEFPTTMMMRSKRSRKQQTEWTQWRSQVTAAMQPVSLSSSSSSHNNNNNRKNGNDDDDVSLLLSPQEKTLRTLLQAAPAYVSMDTTTDDGNDTIDDDNPYVPLRHLVLQHHHRQQANTNNNGNNHNDKWLAHSKLRNMLASHLVERVPAIFFNVPLQETGRSVWHQACMDGDSKLVSILAAAVVSKRVVVAAASKRNNNSNGSKKKNSDANTNTTNNNSSSSSLSLSQHCQDCGWTALHYATLSGDVNTTEVVLHSDPGLLHVPTKDSHSWHKQTKKGVTPRQLVQAVHASLQPLLVTGSSSSKPPKARKLTVESYGRALEELVNRHSSDSSTSATVKLYAFRLDQFDARLGVAESKGYKPLTAAKLQQMEKKQKEFHAAAVAAENAEKAAAAPPPTPVIDPTPDIESSAPAVPKPKRKRKKKKAAMSADTTATTETTASNSNNSNKPAPEAAAQQPPKRKEDPLVTALLGMGFSRDKILQGIEACGGVLRATADDVVMHILGLPEEPRPAASATEQDGSGQSDVANSRVAVIDTQASTVTSSSKGTATNGTVEDNNNNNNNTADATNSDSIAAAERLAAKREEQRRRNREWNNRQKQQHQQAVTAAANKKSPLSSPPAGNTITSSSSAAAAAAVAASSPTVAAATNQSSSWVHVNAHADNNNNNASEAGGNQATTQHNDSSTVNSLNEIGTIEIITNDDATVSTIGSMPARAAAPPGFSVPTAVPEKQVMEELQQQQAHSQQQSSWNPSSVVGLGAADVPIQQQRLGFGDIRNSGGHPQLPPPGISESLLQQQTVLPGRQRSMPAPIEQHIPQPEMFASLRSASLGTSSLRADGGLPTTTSRLGDDPFASSNPLGVGMSHHHHPTGLNPNAQPIDAASLFGAASESAPQSTTGFHGSSFGYGTSALGGMGGFGGLPPAADNSRMAPQQSTTLDAAMVDSISTGNNAGATAMMLGSASLWGNTTSNPDAAPSSLLQDLIRDESTKLTTMDDNNDNGLMLNGLAATSASAASWGMNEDATNNNNTASSSLPPGSHRHGAGSIW